jgi:hypothetical protein
MRHGWGLGSVILLANIAAPAPLSAQALPLLPLEPDAAHFALSLHARRMQASARAEQAVWLTLTVPFDRLVAPPPRAMEALRESPPNAPAPAAPAPPRGVDEPRTRFGFAQLRALSEFARRATRAALAAVGTAAERQRLDGLATRAKTSALLPELRLRAMRNSDQALRWVPTADDPSRITQADAAGVVLEVSATFRLDRLVFAHEELVVQRLRLRDGEDRLKLEARVRGGVLEVFHARELTCALDPSDPGRPAERLKLLEQLAELDALTAGWFSDQAAELGRALWGFPEAILGECEPPEPQAPAAKPAATKAVARLDESE